MSAVRTVERRQRRIAWADNLKVILVAGVIVAHATMAWTGVGTWVLREPPIREPMLSLVTILAVIGSLFGMALFFLIAGLFTPASLERKGTRRFLVDRFIRLGVPMVFFAVVLSPLVEYVDPDNAGWNRGFGAFAVHIWWPPVPGPTWFLGVLLVLSTAYALIRALPGRGSQDEAKSSTLPMRLLAATAIMIAVTSYLLRLAVPLGAERWHLALGQAPAWIAGFGLGVTIAERDWLATVPSAVSRRLRQGAWASTAGLVLVVGTASATGADIDDFGGGGTWQSLVVTAIEGVLVVSMSLWLIAVSRRRLNRQSAFGHRLSRAAFAAFVIHQVLLVWLVLASRQVDWPPEVKYLLVSTTAVAASFAGGALLVRLPGVSRVI